MSKAQDSDVENKMINYPLAPRLIRERKITPNLALFKNYLPCSLKNRKEKPKLNRRISKIKSFQTLREYAQFAIGDIEIESF